MKLNTLTMHTKLLKKICLADVVSKLVLQGSQLAIILQTCSSSPIKD